MKKLILAALAFFGLASPNLAKAADFETVASPVTSLTDGGLYFIYDAHGDDGTYQEVAGSNTYRYAFRRANADNNAIYGTHIKPFNAWNNGANDQLDNYHVWQAIATESGAWKFLNVGKNTYMAASAQMGADAKTFVLEPTDSPTTFKVRVESNQNRWDGNGNTAEFPMSYYQGGGHDINFYEAISEGDGYKFATANGWNVTFTFPTYREGVTAYTKTFPMTEGMDATSLVPTVEFFTASASPLGDNPIVSGDNKDFTVQGTWNLPILPNHVYRMRLRPAYLTGTNAQPQNCRFMHFSGTEADLAYTDIEETEFSTDFFWFFTPAGDITEDGLIPVTLHGMSMPAGDGLEFEVTNLQPGNNQDIAVGFQSSNPTVWYLRSSNVATAGEKDFMLEHSQVLPDYPDKRVYINHRNNKVATWLTSLTSARADDGCVFRAYEMLDSDWAAIAEGSATEEEINNAKENPTVENIKAVVGKMAVPAEDVQDIFDAADYFIDELGLASEADINDWNVEKNSVTDINKVNPTKYALLNSALSTLVYNSSIHMPAEGKHISLRHAISEDEQYLGINGTALSANAEEGKEIFTLKPAENGAGFYLYNEYANKYVTFPATLSSEPSSVYILDMYSDLKNITFGVRTADGAGNIYISKNASNNNIVASAKTDGAQWILTAQNAQNASTQRLTGATDRAQAAVPKGNALKALNITTEAIVTTWDALTEKFTNNTATLEEIDAIPDQCHAMARDVKNVFAILQAQDRTNAFMGVEAGAEVISARASEGAARVMNLIPAENGAGFYIYSPIADRYIIQPTTNGVAATSTDNQADATVYAFDIWPAEDGTYPENTIAFHPTSVTTPGYDYLHARDNKDIVKWEKALASTWVMSLVGGIEEATITLNDADGSELYSETLTIVSGVPFPEYAGFTCDNTENVSATNHTATYTMNEGSPMQIYNERADSYVFVHENGLWQTEDENDEATNFLKVKADEEGGFVIYSPSTKKMVGNLVGANAVTPMVDVNKAQKYYTGKFDGHTADSGEYYPKYADWIGTVTDLDTNEYYFFNDNGNDQANNPANLRYVCAFKRVDAGSKWVIVTNRENFKENWGMREDLIAAKAAYKAALEKVGMEADQTLVDFVDNFYFDGDVNKALSDDTRENYQKLLAAIDAASGNWAVKVMEATKLYTIQASNNKGDNRGFLVYDAENGCINTVTTVDDTNNAHLWGFVHVGDKFYLYNRGAEKFANAYKPYEGQSTIGAAYSWTIGDIPTAIVLSSDAFGNSEALNSNLFVIRGGKEGSINPAGIMIMSNNTDHVPCCLGHNDITDGTGLILTAIRDTDMDDTMIAKVTEGFNMVDDAIDNICMPIEGQEFDADTHGKQVGHFTQAAADEIYAAAETAKAVEDKQEAMYTALDAVIAIKKAESSYRQVENGNVYTISDSEGNIHYTDGTDHLTADDASALDDVKYTYWVATVTDGKVTFSHTHEGPEETPAAARAMYYANTQVVNFAAGDATEFTVNRVANALGRVTLNGDASKTYVISHVSANADDATTAIAEITSASNAGEIYDLQGRRLAAPTHGVNIINGKKVLVK